MSESIWNRSNFFVYGEIGNRLDGIRETEVYKYSANSLTNWYITEAGNLKTAKKYRGIGLVNDEILQVIDTKYHFFIIVTTKELVSFNKVTKNPIARLVHGLGLNKESNISVFENQIFTSVENPTTGGYWNNIFTFNSNGLIGISNYLDTIMSPIKDRKTVKIELYKVYNVSGEMRVVNIGVEENPTIKVIAKNIYLSPSNMKIDKLYTEYKPMITWANLSGGWVGMVIGVFVGYYETAGKSYVIGELPITFSGKTWAETWPGWYYKQIEGVPEGYEGTLEYGTITRLNSDIVDVEVIQNRLALIKNDIIYFSKTFDFNNFRNGTKDDESFYIKPSPIRNQQTKLLKMIAGNVLFVSSNKGIYAIGMDATLTPANSVGITKIISDTPASKEIEVIGNDLYYLSEDNFLYCTQFIYSTQQAQMNNTIVEKYDITKRIKNISVGIVDNKTVLIASTLENKILIYSSIDINMFRKYSIEFETNTKVFGYNKDLINFKSFFEITENNFRNTEIILNPPALKTRKSGSYLNDYESRIERVVINVLNQDRQAIKLVKINSRPLNNLGITQEDYFSLYKHEGKISIIEGFKLEIETKENNKILEIRGIDTLINVAGN